MNKILIASELVKIAKELIGKKKPLTPYGLGYDAGDYQRRLQEEGPGGPNNLSIADWRKKHGFAEQKRVLGPDLDHDKMDEWNRGFRNGNNGRPRSASTERKIARELLAWRSVSGDPFWLTVKYPSECHKCHKPISKGERAFYYPRDRHLYGEKCGHGEEAEADFRTHSEMDTFEN